MTSKIDYLLDYVAIRQLNARYNRAADEADGESFSANFLGDGVFDIAGQQEYRGRAAIAAVCSHMRVAVHVTTEPEIVINDHEASQRVRMLSIFRAPDGTRNEFVASGWYVDQLRKTADGWKFARRRAELDLNIDLVFARMIDAPSLG